MTEAAGSRPEWAGNRHRTAGFLGLDETLCRAAFAPAGDALPAWGGERR